MEEFNCEGLVTLTLTLDEVV